MRGNPRAGAAKYAKATGIFQVLALIAVAIDGLFLELGPIKVNSERIVLGPMLVYILFLAMFGGFPQLNTATKAYLCWGGSVVLSTLLSWSPAKHMSGLIVSIVPVFYFLLFSCRSYGPRGMARMIETWLWVVSVGGLIFYAIWLMTGAFNDTFVGDGRLSFLMLEPNIFGAVVAAMMIMHFAYFRPCFQHFLLHGLALLALLLTTSRFPYLAYAICLAYYLMRSGLVRRASVRAAMAGGIISLAVLIGFFFDRLATAYDSYLNRTYSVDSRSLVLSVAWEHVTRHPIIGNGPLDFGLTNFNLLSLLGSTSDRDLWIWQMFVAILHDEGLIGFCFFIVFLVALWSYTQRMIKDGHRHFLAYQASALSLVISSQGTTQHLNATFGVILGLANSPPFAGRTAPLMRAVRRVSGKVAANMPLRAGAVHVGRRIV